MIFLLSALVAFFIPYKRVQIRWLHMSLLLWAFQNDPSQRSIINLTGTWDVYLICLDTPVTVARFMPVSVWPAVLPTTWLLLSTRVCCNCARLLFYPWPFWDEHLEWPPSLKVMENGKPQATAPGYSSMLHLSFPRLPAFFIKSESTTSVCGRNEKWLGSVQPSSSQHPRETHSQHQPLPLNCGRDPSFMTDLDVRLALSVWLG